MDSARYRSPEEVEAVDHTKLTFVGSGSEAETKALVSRMFQVSKVWLDPAPTAATYLLQETMTVSSIDPRKRRKTEQKQHGPFSTTPMRLPLPAKLVTTGLSKEGRQNLDSVTERRLVRIGATLLTPLDYMANEPGSYKLKMVGQTTWKSRKVLGVDVEFDNWIQCRIGMGPQESSGWYYGTREVRFLIDAENAVPLMIIAYTAPGGHYDPRKGTTWDFDPKFIPVGSGLAPRSITWHSKDDFRGRFRMRLNFQAVNGVWIFRDGEERQGGLISSNPDLSPMRRLDEDLWVWKWELKSLLFKDSKQSPPSITPKGMDN
jgi:hypothetical protein